MGKQSTNHLPSKPNVSMAQSHPQKRHQNESEFGPHFFWLVAARWWKILVPVTLVMIFVSSSLVMVFFVPKYEARAALRIKDLEPFVAFSTTGPADRHNAKKYIATQIELLRSRPILEMVMAKPTIARIPELADRKDPIQWLGTKALVILPKGDSELLEISYAGPDPNSSAELVNAIVDAYFSMRKDRSDEQTRRIVELLEAEKNRREKTIAVLQSEIRELEKQLVAKDPSLIAAAVSDADVVISDSPLKGIQENLARAQVEKKVLEAQIIAMQEAIEREPEIPDVLVDRAVNQSSEIQTSLALIDEKRARLVQISSNSALGDEDPAYRRIQREIGRIQQTVDAIREGARPRILKEMQAVAGVNRRNKLEELRTQLSTQSMVVETMSANYRERLQDVGYSSGQTLDLRVRKDDLLREKQVYDLIAQRSTQLRTEMNAPNRVTPLHLAKAPTVPIESVPWKYLALSLVVSLMLPFGIAAAWEKSINRVTTIGQIEAKSQIPVVGEIAKIPSKSMGRPTQTKYALNVFEESIDSLRTGLFLAHDKDDFQVVAVASAVSGEGKSSVASQLAVSLARATAKPTLIIDGDVRSPDAHHIFHVENEIGLVDVLDGDATLEEAINTSWSQHVHVLPTGRLRKNPHKLFGSGEFKKLLDEARLWYRYIVIDTPPILAASESLVISRDADATLVCAMRDVSREDHVQMTFDRLVAVGARPIGAVLNGVPTRTYAKRYGSYNYAS